jgi:two-component system LytT family response regulator
MHLRAVVVDDEDLARRRLLKLLLKYGEELEIVGEARNGEEAVGLIASLRPDLVFLDVQMPGCDGFEVVRRLQEKPFIVFATAYNEYALKAFEENSVDYLLKPVEQKRLERTMDKLRRLFGTSSPGMSEDIARMLSRMASRTLQRLKVSLGDKIYLIEIQDIAYFESRDKYTYLHTTDREYLIDETLADLECKLDGSTFVRINRSYIVNVKFIREIVRWFAGRYKVRLKDAKETELIATRSYADQIRRL